MIKKSLYKSRNIALYQTNHINQRSIPKSLKNSKIRSKDMSKNLNKRSKWMGQSLRKTNTQASNLSIKKMNIENRKIISYLSKNQWKWLKVFTTNHKNKKMRKNLS